MVDKEFETKIIKDIAEALPSLPEGSIWDKYGKLRIYFNLGNRQKDKDYSFYVDMQTLPYELVDFNKNYWLPQLVVSTERELSKTIEEIYYKLEYPLSKKLPVSTTYEMKIHRRFESTLPENDPEKDEVLKVKPIPLEIEVEVEKEKFDDIMQTGRYDDDSQMIYRFIIDYEYLEELVNTIKEVEDDEDDAFMKELMRKTYGGKEE